jgi:hypothetical protein
LGKIFTENTISDFEDISDDDMAEVRHAIESVIHTDHLGANPDESNSSETSSGETTDEDEVDSPQATILEVTEQDGERRQQLPLEVGDFVTAVYDGNWLLAQVDIDQDKAGDTHVNLSYMERVGYNQFRWPKHVDLLLTLKEDILTRGCTPVMVGSSIRAIYVGLSATQALEANNALAAVVYLQSILSKNLRVAVSIFYHILVLGTQPFSIQYGNSTDKYRYRT